jgi:hypothetical protein
LEWEASMSEQLDAIRRVVGEYFPAVARSLTEDHDLYPALDIGIAALLAGSLSWAELNQVMHLCSEAGMSEGFYRYYLLEAALTHPYPTDRVFGGGSYMPPRTAQVTSEEQLRWGIRRFIYDAMLYWGNLRQAYRDLRQKGFDEIQHLFAARRLDDQRMIRRGRVRDASAIPIDHRYLISEMACKTYESSKALEEAAHVKLALEAFQSLRTERAQITPATLRERTKQVAEGKGQLGLFELLFEDAGGSIETSEQVLALYSGQWDAFKTARAAALKNTRTYLSMCNDLDVYVATSMRTRQDFRDMAATCEEVFRDPRLQKYNMRYFDPTLSAAEHHEDKGIIECLMVKTAKVVLYFAQYKESLGKVSEYAMGLSLGKPVIILCPADTRGQEVFRFYRDSHPLTRLIEFKSGIVNGAMVTYKTEEVVQLLVRIFSNSMEYDLSLKPASDSYYLLKERLTQSTVRVVTDNRLLSETFWNNYHDVY